MAKWKVMRKSTCWARSLPFSHIITEIDLSFPLLLARALSKLRDTTFEMHVCFSFETYTLLLIRPRDLLTCCISFLKNLLQTAGWSQTYLFINESAPPFFDFCKYWKEWRRADSPASSCRLQQDHSGPSHSHQTGRKCGRTRITLSEVTSWCVCVGESKASSVRHAILLTHPAAHFIILSSWGNCTEGAIRTGKLRGCHYFRI